MLPVSLLLVDIIFFMSIFNEIDKQNLAVNEMYLEQSILV